MSNHFTTSFLTRVIQFGAALMTVFAGPSCADVELVPAPVSVSIAGEYCTEDSANFDVPVRILLVIDTSKSMEINDPTGARSRAASQLVDELKQEVPDVAFAFVAFNTGATALTNGFVKDQSVLDQALTGLSMQEGFTNYLAALALAQTMITADIAQVSEDLRALEAAGEDTRYLRPWYFVIFLSDGIPRMPDGTSQSSDTILWEVEDLMDVPDPALGITLHTAFLGATDDSQRPEAEALLKKMARDGGGSYTSYENGDEVDFRMFDFEIKRLFDSKLFLAFNPHAHIEGGIVLTDSDADGLVDVEEMDIGTDPQNPDTDGDLMRDGFEVHLALDPLHPDPHCDGDARFDTDADGLLDCEEDFLNLCPNRFDCDGDLFPDNVELWSGSNPGDGSDILFDPDFDGVLTREELLHHTNPLQQDATVHERYGYRYTMNRRFNSQSGVTCFDFDISNVKLMDTLETATHAAGDNDIHIYVVESPEDEAENLFTLKRAVLRLNRADFKRRHADILLDGLDIDFVQIATQEGRED